MGMRIRFAFYILLYARAQTDKLSQKWRQSHSHVYKNSFEFRSDISNYETAYMLHFTRLMLRDGERFSPESNLVLVRCEKCFENYLIAECLLCKL